MIVAGRPQPARLDDMIGTSSAAQPDPIVTGLPPSIAASITLLACPQARSSDRDQPNQRSILTLTERPSLRRRADCATWAPRADLDSQRSPWRVQPHSEFFASLPSLLAGESGRNDMGFGAASLISEAGFPNRAAPFFYRGCIGVKDGYATDNSL